MLCDQCPRNCAAERTETRSAGVCAMPETVLVARAALHHWEEPPISGTRGAGTVFFSGCNLRCVFCQNSVISQEGVGKRVSPARLREIFEELIAQGAHNIDLVTPTHFSHVLREVLQKPLPVPVIWNSGGYETVKTLRRLEGLVQIYLPDLKYLSSEKAGRYSSAKDYPQAATAAIREMVRQTGPCVLDGEGILQRGVIIRHLLLPGGLTEAKAVMDWVADSFPRGGVLFSLMAQYTPVGELDGFPELQRPLRPSELRAAKAYMENLGLAGYVQELESCGEGFIPAFDLTGV